MAILGTTWISKYHFDIWYVSIIIVEGKWFLQLFVVQKKIVQSGSVDSMLGNAE